MTTLVKLQITTYSQIKGNWQTEGVVYYAVLKANVSITLFFHDTFVVSSSLFHLILLNI